MCRNLVGSYKPTRQGLWRKSDIEFEGGTIKKLTKQWRQGKKKIKKENKHENEEETMNEI
jgi:hypothetical protein